MLLLRPRQLHSLVSVSAPLILFYLSEVLIGLTDLTVVGRLGSVAVSAVGLGKTIIFAYTVMAFSVLSILTVLVGERLGRSGGALAAASQHADTLRSGVGVSLSLSAVGLAIFLISPLMLRALDYDPAVVASYQAYVGYAQFLVVPALLLACIRNLLNGLSSTRIFAYLSFVAVPVNLVLNILLVYGIGPFPAMGVAGAGLATLLVHLVSLGVLILYTVRAHRLSGKDFNPLRSDKATVARIYRLGLPAGAQQFLEGGLFTAVLIIMGLFSADWLAATAVLFAIMEVLFVVCLGFSEIVSARIARHIGDTDTAAMKRTVNSAFLTIILFMLASAVVLLGIPDVIVSVFFGSNGSQEAVRIAIWMTTLVAFFLVFDGLQVAGMYTLRGMQDTVSPLVLGVVGYWGVGLGTGVVLAFVFDYGGAGIWIGFCIGLLASAAALVGLTYWKIRSL